MYTVIEIEMDHSVQFSDQGLQFPSGIYFLIRSHNHVKENQE